MTGSRIPGAWTRASLRARVLLLAVALLTVGFTAFSLVTGNALRGYLADRVDAQLRASAQVFALIPPTAVANGAARKPPSRLGDFSTDVLGNPVIIYVTKDGTVETSVDSLAGTSRTDQARGPVLPRMNTAAVIARDGRPFTVAGTKGDTRWRVIAVPRITGARLPGAATTNAATSGSVVVATTMAQVDSTVNRMWRIYQSTGLGLLVVLAVAAGSRCAPGCVRCPVSRRRPLRSPAATCLVVCPNWPDRKRSWGVWRRH